MAFRISELGILEVRIVQRVGCNPGREVRPKIAASKKMTFEVVKELKTSV